jgi:hypothetical protein
VESGFFLSAELAKLEPDAGRGLVAGAGWVRFHRELYVTDRRSSIR